MALVGNTGVTDMTQNELTDILRYAPRILSDEEVEFYLKGERREIDRLLLYSINRISTVLVEHVRKQEVQATNLAAIGGYDAIGKRAEYVDSLIEKNKKTIRMMEKVEGSGMVWAFMAFIGFVAMASWEYIRTRL
jgi:hypothetical protein